MDIQDGSVAVTFTSGSPIGNGPVSLASANLSMLPAPSASSVTLNYGNLNYGPGGNLIVGRNTNTSLTANFGAIARDPGGNDRPVSR
jgi:hypothetical protein